MILPCPNPPKLLNLVRASSSGEITRVESMKLFDLFRSVLFGSIDSFGCLFGSIVSKFVSISEIHFVRRLFPCRMRTSRPWRLTWLTWLSQRRCQRRVLGGTRWKLQSLTLHISSVLSCSGEGNHDSKSNDSVKMIQWYINKYIYIHVLYTEYICI